MKSKRKQQKSTAVTGITSLKRNQRANMSNQKKKTKLPYYEADTGFFGHKVKICFSDRAFQTAIQKAKITTKHSALDVGVAESHHITQEGTQNVLIAIVFNLEEMSKYDSLEKMGVIVHECVHTVTHMFQHVGEDETKIGDETRAYFTEHLFKQVFSAYAMEEDKYERTRKRDREVSERLGEKIKRSILQMDKHGDGGAGSDSNHQWDDFFGGTEKPDGSTLGAPKTGVSTDWNPRG